MQAENFEVSERGQFAGESHSSSAPSLALDALNRMGGDSALAINMLADRLLADPELIEANLAAMAKSWAREQVGAALTEWRAQIIRQASGIVPRPPAYAGQLAAAMVAEHSRMMDFPLYGGKRLGDATIAEVRESAASYAAISRDTGRKARWQAMIAEAAAATGDELAPIQSILSEATLVNLWGEADAH